MTITSTTDVGAALTAAIQGGYVAQLTGQSRLAHDNPAFRDQLISSMLASLDRAHDHMVLLRRKTPPEKVATFLLDMACRLRKFDRFDLPMHRSDIADHLGLAKETVSRTLTQMDREGLITLAMTGRTIILNDRAGLRQLNA